MLTNRWYQSQIRTHSCT